MIGRIGCKNAFNSIRKDVSDNTSLKKNLLVRTATRRHMNSVTTQAKSSNSALLCGICSPDIEDLSACKTDSCNCHTTGICTCTACSCGPSCPCRLTKYCGCTTTSKCIAHQ